LETFPATELSDHNMLAVETKISYAIPAKKHSVEYGHCVFPCGRIIACARHLRRMSKTHAINHVRWTDPDPKLSRSTNLRIRLPRIRRRCLVFCTPYAKHNPSKYNAANRYKACMDPGYLLAQVSHPQLCSLASDTNRICLKNAHKTSLRWREYTTWRPQLEQQRRRQHDEDKWKSMYKILFPGELAPNLSMHLLT
jgi:hypothetical protein